MRVSGGTGRGRKLAVPSGSQVRPTSDKVKQALFNILGERTNEASVLDLFAGAGGVGIEALSRGAQLVVFVDDSRESVAAIKKNIEQTGFSDRTRVVHASAEAFLKKPSGPYDIVFLDPPYAREMRELLELIAEADIVKPGALIIAEHFKKQPAPEHAGSLVRYRESRYGDTELAFYRKKEAT